MVAKLCTRTYLVAAKTTRISARAPRQAAMSVFLCNPKVSAGAALTVHCADVHYVGSTPAESRLALRPVSPIDPIPYKPKGLAPLWRQFVLLRQLTRAAPNM